MEDEDYCFDELDDDQLIENEAAAIARRDEAIQVSKREEKLRVAIRSELIYREQFQASLTTK